MPIQDVSTVLLIREWLREPCVGVRQTVGFPEVWTFMQNYPLMVAHPLIGHLAPHVSHRVVRKVFVVGNTHSHPPFHAGIQTIPHTAHLQNQEGSTDVQATNNLIWQATRIYGKRPGAPVGNTYLFQLPAPMCLKIFLHPNPLLFTPEAITICHQTRSDSSFQGLSRTNHSNAFPPRLVWIGCGGSSRNGRTRVHICHWHIILHLHRLYMCQNLLLPIMDKTTIRRFYKRLYHLVWQATKVNYKQPATCTSKVHRYLTLQVTSKQPTKLIKMYSKRPGRLSPKN